MRRSLLFMGVLAMFVFAAIGNAVYSDVYFDQTYEYTFIRNDPPRDVGPMLIIDQMGGNVQAANGIRIIVPATLYALWDKDVTSVTATGSAVTAGKMDATLTPQFSANLKEVFIPVKKDFAKDEQVSIEGLKMRIYRIGNDKRYLELDLSGDRVYDVYNFRSISISSSEVRIDRNAPYAVTGAKAVYQDKAMVLTWADSPDLDLSVVHVEKTLTRAGVVVSKSFDVYSGEQKLVDTDVVAGETVTYTLEARDGDGNQSAIVTLTAKAEAATTTTVDQPTEPEPPVDTDLPVDLFSDLSTLSVDDATQVNLVAQRMLDKKTYVLPVSGRLIPSTRLMGTFAMQIAMMLRDGCGSAGADKYPGIFACRRAAQTIGVVPVGYKLYSPVKGITFYEMLLKALNKETHINEAVQFEVENAPLACTEMKTLSTHNKQVYAAAVKTGLLQTFGANRCKLMTSLTRADAMKIAYRAMLIKSGSTLP